MRGRWTACLIGLILLAGLATDSARAQEPRPVTLRVLTYNIHRAVGADGKQDLERIARIIRDAEPDVVALQEVDRGTERARGIDQPAQLAALTGMHPTFAKAIDHQGGEYGQLILTRAEPTASRVHRLPGDPEREQRIALEVTTEKDGRPFRFVTTHLDHRADSPDRLTQARTLASLFAESPLPVVLAGDFNDVPASRTLAVFAADWMNVSAGQSHPTYPASTPARQIDYVLVTPARAWRVRETRVLEEATASDHRPLLSILELGAS